METNATIRKDPNAGAAAAMAMMNKPVTGEPAPNSDIFFFINAAFRKEFEVCAQLTQEHVYISFIADLVKKLNQADTLTYTTALRVPKGCMLRAQVHPVFRRFLVQSMWLQQQPAMLRYQGSEKKIDENAPICNCANPPCEKSAIRFVGNPGFFLQKNLLIDPYCIPVCGQTDCVLQAQQMSSNIHAQAQQQLPQSGANFNPALRAQMPSSMKSCNVCGSYEKAHGGTAVVLRACPLCGLANYCSQQCQIQDWQRGHKDICTNNAAAAAAAKKKSDEKKAKPIPQSIPEESDAATVDTAPAPAPASGPAPAPMPLSRETPSPSPTPMPMPVSAPAPAPMPIQKKQPPSATAVASKPDPVVEVTQGMANIPMPTYKVPEFSAPAAPVQVPTYKMPEPPAAMPTFQTPSFATPGFAPGSDASNAISADAAKPDGSVPIKKGRKKAE